MVDYGATKDRNGRRRTVGRSVQQMVDTWGNVMTVDEAMEANIYETWTARRYEYGSAVVR